ncbi:CG14971 [Drosophila busckii]|uniref:CG14971 n=1 Tax=Drosophila busckii TaxID=30019 RepID=A0A0M4E9S9_DROBS|nr:solute carrier family 35 member C2 [Drosophila busckii]ALC43904.1 CG14971 [Drosophila busckii]
MVAAKYERLNTGDVDAGSDALDDDNIEEVELRLDFTNKNASSNSSQERNGEATSANQRSDSLTMTRHTADARFMQMAIGTLATILLYLTLSITLTFYQTDINRQLPFPLTIVSYHLLLKFALAALVRSIYRLRAGKTRVQLDWRVAVRKMAPTGVASGIDIGFSNWSLALVPISLYTMTKSSTIVFILLFAILLGLERKSWSLFLIVGLIGLGLFMFTYKSSKFNALGFCFILFASLCSGLRWTFAQFIMQKSKLGLHNPIDMIYYMQPWMIATLLPLVLFIEGPRLYVVLEHFSSYAPEDVTWIWTKVTGGAAIAFLMEISEFMVLCKTSSLTLSIAGIFKDICQLALAVALKGDQLSPINLVGLAVCLAGIGCHVMHKYSSMSQLNKQQQVLQLDNDQEDAAAEYDFSKGNTHSGIGQSNAMGKHATLTVPLLEETDSEDESGNDANKQNSSDVIFDVLKRRDMQR